MTASISEAQRRGPPVLQSVMICRLKDNKPTQMFLACGCQETRELLAQKAGTIISQTPPGTPFADELIGGFRASSDRDEWCRLVYARDHQGACYCVMTSKHYPHALAWKFLQQLAERLAVGGGEKGQDAVQMAATSSGREMVLALCEEFKSAPVKQAAQTTIVKSPTKETNTAPAIVLPAIRPSHSMPYKSRPAYPEEDDASAFPQDIDKKIQLIFNNQEPEPETLPSLCSNSPCTDTDKPRDRSSAPALMLQPIRPSNSIMVPSRPSLAFPAVMMDQEVQPLCDGRPKSQSFSSNSTATTRSLSTCSRTTVSTTSTTGSSSSSSNQVTISTQTQTIQQDRWATEPIRVTSSSSRKAKKKKSPKPHKNLPTHNEDDHAKHRQRTVQFEDEGADDVASRMSTTRHSRRRHDDNASSCSRHSSRNAKNTSHHSRSSTYCDDASTCAGSTLADPADYWHGLVPHFDEPTLFPYHVSSGTSVHGTGNSTVASSSIVGGDRDALGGSSWHTTGSAIPRGY